MSEAHEKVETLMEAILEKGAADHLTPEQVLQVLREGAEHQKQVTLRALDLASEMNKGMGASRPGAGMQQAMLPGMGGEDEDGEDDEDEDMDKADMPAGLCKGCKGKVESWMKDKASQMSKGLPGELTLRMDEEAITAALSPILSKMAEQIAKPMAKGIATDPETLTSAVQAGVAHALAEMDIPALIKSATEGAVSARMDEFTTMAKGVTTQASGAAPSPSAQAEQLAALQNAARRLSGETPMNKGVQPSGKLTDEEVGSAMKMKLFAQGEIDQNAVGCLHPQRVQQIRDKLTNA